MLWPCCVCVSIIILIYNYGPHRNIYHPIYQLLYIFIIIIIIILLLFISPVMMMFCIVYIGGLLFYLHVN